MEVSKPESIGTLAYDQQLIGLWEWDIPAKKKFMSPVFKEMLGYTDSEISNDTDSWIGLILKEDRPAVISAYQKHVSSKASRPYEVKARYHHKDGSIVHVLSKGKVTDWDFMGNPVKMVGYSVDITPVVKEYAHISERHDQYKKVVDFVHAGIWTHDVHTGQNNWSENMYSATSYQPDQLAPSYFNLLHVLTHPDDTLKLVEAINTQVKNKQPYDLYVRLIGQDKTFNWFETSGTVDFDEHGRPEKVTGFFIKQKHGFEKPEEASYHKNGVAVPEKIPAQPEPKNGDTLVTGTPLNENHAESSEMDLQEGEWEYDLAEAKFSFSNEVYDLLELPADASLRFQSVNGMLSKESQIIFQKAFNVAVYHKESYEITLLFKTPQGNLKLLKEKGRPVTDDSGKVILLRGTLTAIEPASLSAEAMAFVKLLSEQNRQLWSFAHIASHNLRGHASNLQMTLELINNCETEEEKRMFMAPIKKISAAFSQSIINLNKLLFTETDLNKTRVLIALEEVLSNVTSALATQISETHTKIEADFSQCPTIEYIPAYIESIMLNLISNAIKYRHPQRTPVITLRSFVKDDRKILTVKDNGVGIDLNKYGNTLFSSQQAISRHPDSRGLGLLITKNQVESLGGTIDVESEPGVGTTFIISF